MHIKQMAFLGLAIISGLAAIYGMYIAMPLILEGYKPHKSTDMNGLIAFVGLLFLVPTLLVGSLALLFGTLFWREAHKKRAPSPQATAPGPGAISPTPQAPDDRPSGPAAT